MENTSEVKTINNSILGRNRKKYDTMKTLESVTEKEIENSMKLDIEIYNKQNNTSFTLDDYKTMLEKLNKPSNKGKREEDKITRDNLISATQDFCGCANLAISAKQEKVKLSNKQKLEFFDKFSDISEKLNNLMVTSFDNVGAITMLWSPACIEKSANTGMSVHVGGWDDGAKNPRFQYAPRKRPIAKRSGYLDNSFSIPCIELTPEKETPEKPKKEKKSK